MHIYILDPKLLRWNFLQISRHSPGLAPCTPMVYEVVRTTFPPIFGLFVIFDGSFAKIVVPPGDINENHVVHLTEQSLMKNC